MNIKEKLELGQLIIDNIFLSQSLPIVKDKINTIQHYYYVDYTLDKNKMLVLWYTPVKCSYKHANRTGIDHAVNRKEHLIDLGYELIYLNVEDLLSDWQTTRDRIVVSLHDMLPQHYTQLQREQDNKEQNEYLKNIMLSYAVQLRKGKRVPSEFVVAVADYLKGIQDV